MSAPERQVFLACESLEKLFSGVRALKGVSLEVRAGETVAIVGENGAGKSTLMNLIGGVHRPDGGRMRVAGQPYEPATPLDAAVAGIAFVHQELNLFPNLSIAENIFLAGFPVRRVAGLPFIDRNAAAKRTREMLAEVGLNRLSDTLVEELPQGDRQLVEIAKALNMNARLVIFDEPTTSLTFREVERLFAIVARLKRNGMAVLYISHALEHVAELADRVIVLRDGAAAGEYSRGDFSMDGLIRAMVGRSIQQMFPERVPRTPGEVLLELRSVSEPGVVEKISFQLHAGEILGIAGLMGSGRSELARIVFGLDGMAGGEIRLLGRNITRWPTRGRIAAGLAFLTESRREDGLFMDASVEENVRIVYPRAGGALSLIRDLRIACADPARQPVGELSGGNQQKAALAKWLLDPPRALILDEPTRGIDVGAKQEIYGLMAQLAGRGIGLLVISSEVEELVGMCDRILVMGKGEIRAEFSAGCTREQIIGAAV